MAAPSPTPTPAAAPVPTLDVNVSAFNRAAGAIAGLVGANLREFVMSELGAIINTCISRTSVASHEKIARQTPTTAWLNYRNSAGFRGLPTGQARLNTRKQRGRGWVKLLAGGKPVFLQAVENGAEVLTKAALVKRNGVPTPKRGGRGLAALAMQQAQAQRAQRRKEKNRATKSRGLAVASWFGWAALSNIDLASAAGTKPSALKLGAAREAWAKHPKSKLNSTVNEAATASRFQVTVTNLLPYARKVGMDGILSWVIGGRAKYAEMTIGRNANKAVERILKNYPGFRTRTPGG